MGLDTKHEINKNKLDKLDKIYSQDKINIKR